MSEEDKKIYKNTTFWTIVILLISIIWIIIVEILSKV
jgi:hypothetical protein